MATDKSIVAYLVDQLSAAGAVTAKAMFGEYGVYLNGKMIALICDGQLFVKATAAGRAFAPDAAEAPPYPGAKPCLLIDPDGWDDRDWLGHLATLTAAELPAPKPKSARRANRP